MDDILLKISLGPNHPLARHRERDDVAKEMPEALSSNNVLQFLFMDHSALALNVGGPVLSLLLLPSLRLGLLKIHTCPSLPLLAALTTSAGSTGFYLTES